MAQSDCRHANSFRSAGGLLFVAAALSLSMAAAWTAPAGMARRPPPTTVPLPLPSRAARAFPPLPSSGTASSPDRQRLIAREGDWAAYVDPGYGRVYYFNHATGESLWDPPTPTFPIVPPDVAGGGPMRPPPPPGMEGPIMEGGPMMMGPGLGPMDDPRMAMGDDGGMMGGGPLGGGPMGEGPMGPQAQHTQQQQQPTFYETLRVDPTATRAQIKQSYLDLVKQYDARAEGGRRSREFNEIARAWMVLSDGRSRERYDRQLEQWGRERRMREKMVEEERQWLVDQQGRSMTGTENKFSKDPVYRKKAETSDDDVVDKFGGRFRPRQQQQQQQQGGGRLEDRGAEGMGFGARPLEIDQEAEATGFQMQGAPSEGRSGSYAVHQIEMEAEREALVREKREAEARLAQEQAREQARERKEQLMNERMREERRRAGSERDVIQDKPGGRQQPQQPMAQRIGGQDMNAMMAGMKERFSQKKMDEAARVKDELSKLQGGGVSSPAGSGARGSAPFTSPIAAGGQSDARPSPKRTGGSAGGSRSILFPGRGGIVVEDSPFVAKDILLDEYLGREPSFISWVPPEENVSGNEAASNIRAAMSSVQVGPAPAATMSGEQEREKERLKRIRSLGMGKQQKQPERSRGFGDQLKSGPTGAGSPPPKNTSTAREQERLQGMKAMGTGRQGAGVGPSMAERTTLGTERPVAKSSSDVREQQRLQEIGLIMQRARPSDPTVGEPKPAGAQELEEEHRAEMERLKSNMEEAAAKTMEEEILKIAKIHASEITKLKDDFEASRSQWQKGSKADADGAVEQLKINQAAEREQMEARIKEMQRAHKAEISRILSEQGSRSIGEDGTQLRAEIDQLKQSHVAELGDMTAKHDSDMAKLREDLEARSAEMAKEHQREIQKLTKDQKAASVADTLKFQEMAMEKLGVKHKEDIQGLVARHGQEMDDLRKDLEAKSARDVQVKVEEVTKSISAQHKADMEKMAAQHRQEMQALVQHELKSLQEKHEREMNEALAGSRRLEQQAESVKHELSKAAQGGGGRAAMMTKKQKIEMVLKSFEGVYDPSLIEQLRKDLKAREDDLNSKISKSNQQILTLQSRLDSSLSTEEKLNGEIRTLTQWKRSAEMELQRIRQSVNERNDEVLNLNNSIQSMAKEIAELKARLRRLTEERDASKREIWELREWKKNAEVERDGLERDLKAKDGVIAKLKYEFSERDEDVNVLVPEVARLQELTATLQDLNDKRSNDFELLKQEAERLKSQYEKESKSAADMAQSLKSQLANEQRKNSALIANLQGDLKSKESEISDLQTTANERTRAVAEMKSKLEALRKESEKAVEDGRNKIAAMSADFDRRLAKEKAAHEAQLAELGGKLQGDIQRLQRDLSSRSVIITDLKTKLDASSASYKKMAGEIVGLNNQRSSAELLLKQSSRNFDMARQDVARLKQEIQYTKKSDAANTARIKNLEGELMTRSAALDRLQSGANQLASEKEQLVANLNEIRLWKDSAQDAIGRLSNEVALNALSDEIAQTKEGAIGEAIKMLSSIRNELKQKDTQLSYVESATDSMLEMQQLGQDPSYRQNIIETRTPTPENGGNAWLRKATLTSANVIGAGFSSRHRNIATVREEKFTSHSNPNGSEPQTATTMPAYDAALAAMKSKKTTPKGESQTATSGHQNKQWGGYLDSLSAQ